jgi:O-antigen/teichoic acid export membrane protein
MYLKYMGAEAYGLVGFFTMLQAWFNLLDMGLTPTVAREAARFRGRATDALSYRRLLRALQLIFVSIAFIGGSTLFAFSGFIAHHWLNVQSLSFDQVEIALKLMALGVALRWMSGLYRGCISGAEELVWLGGFNAILATLRFVVVVPVLIWIGHSTQIFFAYQLLVAVIELGCLMVKARGTFPKIPDEKPLGWSASFLFAPIKSVLGFSLTIAFTSTIWILVTQADKLILSKLLALSEYGYFTLAVLAASGVMMVSGPITSALLPRMARLQAEGDEAGLIALYRNATQMVAVIALPTCLLLAFFPEQVLWIWTGDMHAAAQAAPVLRLYALGNGFLVISAFPYYLQFAKGDLRLHLLGNLFFLLFLIPLLIWASMKYGSSGAGYVWLFSNAMYLLAWAPMVHRRFAKGLHHQWLIHDLGLIAFPSALVAMGLFFLVRRSSSRIVELVWIAFFGVLLLIVSTSASKFARGIFVNMWKKRSLPR